jgi:hypothetical protein
VTLLEREFTIESEELNPTHKIKRRVVEDRLRDRIEKMYNQPTMAAQRGLLDEFSLSLELIRTVRREFIMIIRRGVDQVPGARRIRRAPGHGMRRDRPPLFACDKEKGRRARRVLGQNLDTDVMPPEFAFPRRDP